MVDPIFGGCFGDGSHLGSFPAPGWVLFWGPILGGEEGIPQLGLCGVPVGQIPFWGPCAPIFEVLPLSGVLFWGPLLGGGPTVGVLLWRFPFCGFMLGWGLPL